MKKSGNGFLSEILSGRTNLIEVLIVVIFAALGINLVTDGIILHTGLTPLASVILGVFLCLISIFYFVARVFGRRTRFRCYEGFFIYHKKNNEVIPVPRYDFSEDLSEYLKAAFFENKALKSIWEKEPLSDWSPQKKLRTFNLVREATEYFVLSKLSTHLADYFNDVQFREENLREFQRNDVPDVLLKNRFLELFSKAMEDRPPFVDESFDEKDDGKTVAAYIDGAIYERFDLVLPKESVVHRVGENKVAIETKRFIINITVRFDGENAYIPFDFEKHYLSVDDPIEDIIEFCFYVDVQVLFKFGALLSRTGWEYYQWIDSFLEVLDKSLSQSTFFESIGWNTTMTVIRCLTAKPKTKKLKNATHSRKKGKN